MIQKALILAAGYGTRLRPLTCATPKPLLPVWGEAMIDRMLTLLREHGVEDVVVNAHYLAPQIRAWGEARGVRVSEEKEILGSGGALNPLRDWVGSEPFYLVNADIVIDDLPDLNAAFDAIKTRDDVLGVCLTTEQGPRTIEVEPESSFVTNWKSDDAGVDGTFTYCGVAALKPHVLDFVSPSGASSIIEAYEKAMMAGCFMKSLFVPDLLWEDAGTIEKYIELNRDGDENAFSDIPSLKAIGEKDFTFLSARGSERVFFSCGKGVAILFDDANRPENAKYALHARYLKAKGVHVPEVVYEDKAAKTLVLEHVGAEKKMTLQDYVRVVPALVKFHALGQDPDLPKNLEPAFDRALYAWERDLFRQYCLGGLFARAIPPAVEKELEGVAERLLAEPLALVHRDFQSTNILWKGDTFAFIDFQGMRLGPAAYDLASLVYDPYVALPEKTRAAVVRLYATESKRPEIEEILPFAAVQRLVQCLGAYGRLASVGQNQFKKFVLPALENLLAAADLANLDATGALAEDLLGLLCHAHTHDHHDEEDA